MHPRPKFLTHLLLTPQRDGRNWRVEAPFAYLRARPNANPRCLTVPTGFVTDLASIPQIFWNILPPFGKYTEAAVLHDWLYRTQIVSRAEADAVLLEAMRCCNTARWQRAVIYCAVRVFGGKAWRDDSRHLIRPPAEDEKYGGRHYLSRHD